MEDDDDFGDLYTDVLRPLSAVLQPHQTSPAPSSLHRPIDLNLKFNDQDSPNPASFPIPTPPHTTLTPEPVLPQIHAPTRDDKDLEFTENKDVKVEFNIEEGNHGISSDNDGPGIEIPGISQKDVAVNEEGQDVSIPGISEKDVVMNEEGQDVEEKRNDVVGQQEEDDWESDSEDDLQIVLNEEKHRPMLIDEGGGDGDDDDVDGDPLVLVGDVDASTHQGLMVEEQEWGRDDGAAQMGDVGAEKKEGTGERVNGAAVAPASTKIGYSSPFAYHNPYHSQFKVSVL